MKKVKLSDISYKCIDPDANSFEIKWGDDPSECIHIYYDHYAKDNKIFFVLEDEDYPDEIIGIMDNPGINDPYGDTIVKSMITSLMGYLVAKEKIVLSLI